MPPPAVSYVPRPYVRGGSLGELLRLRGQHAAEAELRGGQIQAELWSNLGNTIGQTIQGISKERQDAPIRARQAEMDEIALTNARRERDAGDRLNRQDTAFMALFDKFPDGNIPPRETMSIYGPQRGMQIAQGLTAFGELASKKDTNARETAGRLAIGMTALSPEMQRMMWPRVRAAAIEGGLGDAQTIPETLDPSFLNGVIGWSRGELPQTAAPKTREIRVRNADGSESIQIVEDTPGQAFTSAAPQPDNLDDAIFAAVRSGDRTEVQRLIGIKGQVAAAGRAPNEPDFEWVLRNGEATQIHKGTAQQGDVPYRPPQSTSETAQDRQRTARTDAARDFLGRLNELRSKINTRTGPAAGLTGIARRGAATVGLDPDVAEYERIRAAGGRALAVAIMGAQNLSDADASAWANMLPDARTDEETAERLTTQVERMLNGMTGGAPTQPPGTPPPNAATPNLSGLTPGQGRKFTAGPFAGQTWTIRDGEAVRIE